MLSSQGETSNDIMVILFKGYKAITDSQLNNTSPRRSVNTMREATSQKSSS